MLQSITVFFLSLIVHYAEYLNNDSNISSHKLQIYLCCHVDNDLYRTLNENDFDCIRFDDSAAAIAQVPEASSLLILADRYPQDTTRIIPQHFEQARRKKLRLYVEYPGWLPEIQVSPPRRLSIERAVIASDFFGLKLKKLRIMSIHSKHIVPVDVPEPHLVAARVAGFDYAVYGLPEETFPILFEHPMKDMLIATTKLSHFVTGRHSPTDAVRTMWWKILQ